MPIRFLLLAAMLLCVRPRCAAADTMRVMTYNVLNYGETPSCQGPSGIYHGYLKTIVAYTRPDVLGLVKMGAVRRSPADASGNAPFGFGDSVLGRALNAAFAGRYAYCPVTNTAGADAISMLFYNQEKLGYLATIINYPKTTDFNVYKFFYRDPALAQGGDTTFLYIILNHTKSGDSYDSYRGAQIDGYMRLVQNQFRHLPNTISMGDFNTRSTLEACYQILTAPFDTAFTFYEPAFFPDAKLSYPADWTANPSAFASWLTTSTRQANLPNGCGSDGGAKSWYDHIFISPWLADGSNYIRYISGSYQVVGNDGQHAGISINDSNRQANRSAPPEVINALFQMSNKYPVIADFELRPNPGGTSPADPDMAAAQIRRTASGESGFSMINPVRGELRLKVPVSASGKSIQLHCYRMDGALVQEFNALAVGETVSWSCTLPPGPYYINARLDGVPVLRALAVVMQ